MVSLQYTYKNGHDWGMVLSGRHMAHGIVKNPLLNEFAG
jgi:hypothetical protein